MGFFDDLQGFGSALESKVLEQHKKVFHQASDYKLQEWWNEKQYDDEVDQRVKDLAQAELRRRGLPY